jgi:hypothetical protein
VADDEHVVRDQSHWFLSAGRLRVERLRMDVALQRLRAEAGLIECKPLRFGCPGCSMELAELYGQDPGVCPRCEAKLPAGYLGPDWEGHRGVCERLRDGTWTTARTAAGNG